ncbi:hypothetical protein BaRGS_00031880 [Batillaria attramentaria]|uniref:CARD domain-containing protein n=1 Tax=Batillaria attramentaria TaxID=370345 RepID=A0ABD0JPU4_9CAEN
MEEHDQKVLCRAWKFLVNDVSDVEGVIDCLFSQEVLTPNSRRRIMQGYNVQSDRMREALDEVIKTPNGLNILRQALLENGENAAAARLEPKAHQKMAGKESSAGPDISIRASMGAANKIKDRTERWITREQDVYVETEGHRRAVRQLQSRKVLVITGPQGSGKSALGHALLRHFSTDHTPLDIHSHEE